MAMAKRFVQNNNSNAICYYRYSSDAQREASIEQQRKEAHAYAKTHKLHIIKEYEDRALSGSRDDRPGFLAMLNEVKKLRPAYLILWKTDRLSRDKIDAVLAKKALRDAGCEIVYVAEAMPEDEAERVLLESIQEGLAQHFLIQHKKNVTRGMKYNAENCLFNGHVLLGYIGQQNCHYQIDTTTAPTVKMIFQKYADGVPTKEIVDELNNAGIRTVRGKQFTINSIRSILHNRAYIGEYRWGDYKIPDGMPRIIEDSLFEAVQERLALNKHGGNRVVIEKQTVQENVVYWLTDYMKCGICGETMHGLSGTSKHGKLYYYYVCHNHRKHECAKKNVRKELVEDTVFYLLRELLQNSALRILIAERCYVYYLEQNSDGGAFLESIKQRIAEVDKKLSNIMKAVEAGIFNDTTAQRMKELENEKALLKDEYAAEEIRQMYKLKLEDIVKYLENICNNFEDEDSKKKLLELFVEKIYIYDDKLVVNFFYSDNQREVSFEKMQEIFAIDKRIETAMDDSTLRGRVSMEMLASMLGENEEDSDFFA